MAAKRIAGIIMLLVGMVFGGIGGYMYQSQQDAIDNAVEVEGTIVDTDVREEVRTVRDTDAAGNSRTERSYYPVAVYEYSYEGSTYTNDNIFPGAGNRSTGESRAAEIANRYEVDRPVTVYVNSETPADSYLIEETSPIGLIMAVVGFVLMPIGLVTALGLVDPFNGSE